MRASSSSTSSGAAARMVIATCRCWAPWSCWPSSTAQPPEEDHELVALSKPEGAHLAFRVAERAALDTLHARARERRIPVIAALDLGHAHSLFVRDPDGTAVELYWATGRPHHDRPRPLDLE
jgi:Glyoxalase/Bleomycin resistance protein/Dioxygenase superfamily